jgi:hypothetical protein
MTDVPATVEPPAEQDEAASPLAPAGPAFLAALEAAKQAIGQTPPDSREDARRMRLTQKRTLRALKRAQGVRRAFLAKESLAAQLTLAQQPLNRIRSRYRRRRWGLEFLAYAQRTWKLWLLIGVLGLIWAVRAQILWLVQALVQILPW